MRNVSIRDLQAHTSELVRAAASGEIIVIDRCGEPVAELRPQLRRRTIVEADRKRDR